MNEIWKQVAGYEGLYEVSNLGRVKSLYAGKGRILKDRPKKNHYLGVALQCAGTRKDLLIHRLVSVAFIKNPINKPDVNHINGFRNDNRADNLEWVTKAENIKHSIQLGRPRGCEKVILQFDSQGILVNQYTSGIEAARAIGRSKSSITNYCNGTRSDPKGFTWEYGIK